MRRPLKPFAVEVRRSGRRALQPFLPTRELVEEAPQPDYFTPFSEPAAPAKPPALEEAPRRVLQDLNEPQHDPLAERLQQLESRLARRGRPRGSKNKVKRSPAPAPFDLSAFFESPEVPEPAPAPVVLAAIAYTPRPRAQRFGWIKKKLPRGERWKRRLPKILW